MIVLKILAAPVMVALSLLAAMVTFLFCVASAVCELGCIAFLWNGRPRSFAAMRNKPGTPSLVLPPSMALE